MDQLNFKVIGIGSFPANCIREIDRNSIPQVKTMVCSHLSEHDMYNVNKFLSEEPGISIIIADTGHEPCDSLAIATINSSDNTGSVTLCILTTPFIFEGKKAFNRALKTTKIIQSFSDSSLIISKEPPEDPDFTFMGMDHRIGTNLDTSTIAEMVSNLVELTNPSDSINIDAKDLELSLRDKGTFVIARGEGSGKNRLSEALAEALSSPLMDKCDIYTSRNILIKILVSDQTELRTEEISALTRFIERMPSYVDVKWGIAKSDDLKGEVDIILLAAGFDVKLPEK